MFNSSLSQIMARPVLRTLLSTNSSSPPSAAQAPSQFASVEPDYVVIIAALLCALICIIGVFSVVRCAWLHRVRVGATGGQSSPTAVAAATATSAAANRGLKKKVLQTLPKFSYDPSSSTTGECAICLSEYIEGDEIKVLPQCGHGFHGDCIDTWLGSHSSCPSCRQIFIAGRCGKCGDFRGNSYGVQIQGWNYLT